jgi:hypothetical protein
LEHKNLGREFLDSKEISENANMLWYDMQPNALLVWQKKLSEKVGVAQAVAQV